MRVGAATDVGRVRKTNEDGFVAGPGVFAVADGMGGHDAGEIASGIAIEALRGMEFPLIDPIAEIRAAFLDINERIYERSRSDPGCAGMGTTLTALILGDGCAYVGHVGDSRAYLLRAGELKQITDDHSIVGELLRRGGITEEEAKSHPHRNIITRALGTFLHVEADVFRIDTREGDVFLLCTDGLFSELDNQELLSILMNASNPQEASERLVATARMRGGSDNITVVVISLD